MLSNDVYVRHGRLGSRVSHSHTNVHVLCSDWRLYEYQSACDGGRHAHGTAENLFSLWKSEKHVLRLCQNPGQQLLSDGALPNALACPEPLQQPTGLWPETLSGEINVCHHFLIQLFFFSSFFTPNPHLRKICLSINSNKEIYSQETNSLNFEELSSVAFTF